ncbi:inner membrane transporter RhtA [Arthrobacter tumbae]|nr:inner membrane transporter RhtA [Arthrobacter tumbae]
MMNTQSGTGRATGIATLMGSAVSNQLGAATGSLAFPVLGPAGVVALRQIIAAAVLLPTVRPHVWRFTWAQWWPIILLAVVFGTMNLGLYSAVERIGLGLAVTLEFLGPLAVAIFTRRSRKSAVCGAIAAAGVVAIAKPEVTSDYFGIGCALLAALSWAAYILLNRTVGTRVPGIEGTAVAAGLSAVAFAPIAVLIILEARPSTTMLAYAVAAGILSSVVPYVADLVALRHIPANLFGILMSSNPVFAAIIGVVALQQLLNPAEVLGIALIVIANVAAASRSQLRPARPPAFLRRTRPAPPLPSAAAHWPRTDPDEQRRRRLPGPVRATQRCPPPDRRRIPSPDSSA